MAIDFPIGADYLWYFQCGDIIKSQPGEPVAIQTALGYVLSGPVHGVTRENLQLERQEMQLWDYDSIGIREQNEVRDYLLDNTEFIGERY